MAKIREDKWQHGSIIYRGCTVHVQRIGTAEDPEWFASIREPGFVLMVMAGPMGTQRLAEEMLVDGLNALFAGGDDPERLRELQAKRCPHCGSTRCFGGTVGDMRCCVTDKPV